MDLEVDNNGPGNAATPTGVARWNITVAHNILTAGSSLGFSSEQGICIPQKNLSITNNTVTTPGLGLSMVLGGSGSASCGRDSGLTIANNRVLSGANSPCGGSIATPPGYSIIEIADYQNLLIACDRFDMSGHASPCRASMPPPWRTMLRQRLGHLGHDSGAVPSDGVSPDRQRLSLRQLRLAHCPGGSDRRVSTAGLCPRLDAKCSTPAGAEP